MSDHEHRRFPFYFVHQLLPELFFPDPQRFFSSLTAESLRSVWLEGNRELKEKTPPDGLAIETVSAIDHLARLIRLPGPRYPGEAVAVLLTSRPALYCLEKAEADYALTRIEANGTHHFVRALSSSDIALFIQLVKIL
ncbi:MAG: hypothetical protein U0931_14790 [Vulcanimicrobiota bacterium]